MNIDWNAKGYQKDFAFVPKYGEAVLDLIDAAPGALAVDLGCGNGGLTGKLIERGYRVVGVDASAPMLALAKERYPDTTFLQADACTFQLPEQATLRLSSSLAGSWSVSSAARVVPRLSMRRWKKSLRPMG